MTSSSTRSTSKIDPGWETDNLNVVLSFNLEEIETAAWEEVRAGSMTSLCLVPGPSAG